MNHLPPLVYRVAGPGSAPWVTFVPGIGNDRTFWRVQSQLLSRHFQVLTFDPWGHGESAAPPPDCRFSDIVDAVTVLWDRLGIERSSLVGLGFGGSVSLAIALATPDRVERLVACCCRARLPDERRDFWRKRLDAAQTRGMDALADATVDRWLSPEFRAANPDVDSELRTMMRRTSVEGYCAYVRAFIEMDLDAQLAGLRVPTLLVAAEHDHGGGPVEDMRQMAARTPEATIEVISRSGHICNYEAPDRLNLLLHRFLAEPVR